jgi:hypothetical protein
VKGRTGETVFSILEIHPGRPWGPHSLIIIRYLGYNYESNQQDALYRFIYYSKSALHVSGDDFAHHQEHLTVFTVSGSVHTSFCRLVSLQETLHYITIHYITLHYITLHYITLHYVTSHHTTLHYTTLQYNTLHRITLHYDTLHNHAS